METVFHLCVYTNLFWFWPGYSLFSQLILLMRRNSQSRVILEKATTAQPVQKFPVFDVIRRLISLHKSPPLAISWVIWIQQSTSSHCFLMIYHRHLGLPVSCPFMFSGQNSVYISNLSYPTRWWWNGFLITNFNNERSTLTSADHGYLWLQNTKTARLYGHLITYEIKYSKLPTTRKV
jgi:hypothetical protein